MVAILCCMLGLPGEFLQMTISSIPVKSECLGLGARCQCLFLKIPR